MADLNKIKLPDGNTYTIKDDSGTNSSHTHTKSQISDFPTSMPANGGNADTVDTLHLSTLIPYKSSTTLYFQRALTSSTAITWAQLLAISSAAIGDCYKISDKSNQVWVCKKTVTAACTTTNYSTYWWEGTISETEYPRLENNNDFYVKLTNATTYNSSMIKLVIFGAYTNVSGRTEVDMYAISWCMDIHSMMYNGNNLKGVYQPPTYSGDGYAKHLYLKFEGPNGSYTASSTSQMVGTISVWSSDTSVTLEIIDSTNSEYSTVSQYSYIDIMREGGITTINGTNTSLGLYGNLKPRYNNQYALGASSGYWLNAYISNIYSTTINATTINENGTALSSKYQAINTCLPLSGGTMTGNLNIGDGTHVLMFRTNTSWASGMYYNTASDEAMVFMNKGSNSDHYATSWIFAYGNPTARTAWTSLTPAMQIKESSVVINKLLGSKVGADYNLDVNGTANATTLYENGTAISTTYASKTYVDDAISAAITTALNTSV